jgi:acetoin utilization deacetylase AcuC-like enzyme
VDLLCLHDASCAAHVPPGGHPERPQRLAATLAGLRAGASLVEEAPPLASRAQLERVHPARQLDALDAACARGGWIDADTWAGPGSAEALRRAAGAGARAVAAVLAGEHRTAFCCVRPPGHHARPEQAMGFCLVNNAAIAVREAQALGCRRVAVVDWDVHHGNGTQDVFWRDPDVLVVSLHQWPLWPGTGAALECGAGAGAGTTLNLPLAPGTGPDAYLARFSGEVVPAVERHAPELVVVSCGFDAHRDDPLGGLALDDAAFGTLAAVLVELCDRRGIPRPVVLLEGGYDLGALERGACRVAAALVAEPGDEPLG